MWQIAEPASASNLSTREPWAIVEKWLHVKLRSERKIAFLQPTW
jgi:hypothetical protein